MNFSFFVNTQWNHFSVRQVTFSIVPRTFTKTHMRNFLQTNKRKIRWYGKLWKTIQSNDWLQKKVSRTQKFIFKISWDDNDHHHQHPSCAWKLPFFQKSCACCSLRWASQKNFYFHLRLYIFIWSEPFISVEKYPFSFFSYPTLVLPLSINFSTVNISMFLKHVCLCVLCGNGGREMVMEDSALD